LVLIINHHFPSTAIESKPRTRNNILHVL